MAKDRLRVWAIIPASPENVYRAWLDSNEHSAFTGSKATFDPNGRFSAWDGYITGTTVDRHPGRRIVQTWRTSEFPKGSTDSRLEIQLERLADGTRMTLIHTDIPEGQGERYKDGWTTNYFNPMKAYFGKFLTRESLARKAAAQKAVPKVVPIKAQPAKGAPPKAIAKTAPAKVPTKKSVAKPAPKAARPKPATALKKKTAPARAKAKKPVKKAKKR